MAALPVPTLAHPDPLHPDPCTDMIVLKYVWQHVPSSLTTGWRSAIPFQMLLPLPPFPAMPHSPNATSHKTHCTMCCLLPLSVTASLPYPDHVSMPYFLLRPRQRGGDPVSIDSPTLSYGGDKLINQNLPWLGLAGQYCVIFWFMSSSLSELPNAWCLVSEVWLFLFNKR